MDKEGLNAILWRLGEIKRSVINSEDSIKASIDGDLLNFVMMQQEIKNLQHEIKVQKAAFKKIAAMETAGANSTVRRMARVAKQFS
jgi:hypothetical protein